MGLCLMTCIENCGSDLNVASNCKEHQRLCALCRLETESVN